MSDVPRSHAIYLSGGPDHVYSVLHLPAGQQARDTAVILCPPFGWDEVCSYRPRRAWAQRLSEAGYPTLRVTLPATGDSGGSPDDPDRLGAWSAAIDAAARWLLDNTAAVRVAAIGIELGGMVACHALAGGAPIEELVLWGTPARGKSLVRQLRALSRLESARFFEGLEAPPAVEGRLEAGGFALSVQTRQTLDALDLTALRLPREFLKRALLLHRDSIAPDPDLGAALSRAGATVTVARGDGYAAMTVHPQRGQTPLEVAEQVRRWLEETAAPVGASPVSGSGREASVEFTTPNGAVRETVVAIEQDFGELSAVLAEPLGSSPDDLCLILLNAGAIRRMGPNRMWVELARRWAARGVPSLRLDLEGLGDSDGDATSYIEDSGFYTKDRMPQVLAAIEFLHERGVGRRFAVAGLCAGGYWSFHAALRDPRVSTALMVNASRVVWDPALAPARDVRRLLTQRPSWSKVRRAYSEGRVHQVGRWALGAPRRGASRLRTASASPTDMRDALLEQFLAAGKRALLLFSEGEAFEGELRRAGWIERLDNSPDITVEQIKVRDHTLRPSSAQAAAHAALDRALERELVVPSPDGLGELVT